MEKEMVQKFDLEAAFKALDEIDTPKAKGLKANRVDLKERFATKGYGDELVEDYYNINDKEALEEAKEDREAEVAKAKLARIEKIVDLDAQTEDDLLPSYVGKVIIQCPQCMTLFYKNPEDIEKSEENPDVVNINEICQHCGNASGYTLIGKVDTVSEDEAANYETTEEEENELNLDFGEPTEEVSPEGTGGGFEDEEVVIEEESEDSSDDELDLEEIDLDIEAPVEESIQHEQLNEEVKEITDEVVTKELDLPVVEEGSDDSSDDELKEALSPSEIEAKLDAFAASLGVEEGYTGNPAERTTHLEYTDDNPTDGKAILPDNIEKQLTEEENKDCDCKNGICECGNKNAAETPLAEGKYDVSDAEFRSMLQDKTFQEFGEDLKEEKIEEAKKGLPSDAFVDKLANNILDTANEFDAVDEGIGSAIGSVVSGVGNGIKSLLASDDAEKKDEECKDCEEGLGTAIANVATGVGAGLVNLLASDEAEKQSIEEDAIMNKNDSQGRVDNRQITKPEEKEASALPTITNTDGITEDAIVPNMDFGGVNINLDASGQNNAVGFGGSQPKVESCEHCEDEKKVCEKCGKEICECDKVKEGLPGLDNLPSLPGLGGLPGLGEKLEDLHEESLNKHISDYLTEVYANVKDFKATNCSFKGNTLVVEGIINFNSGKSRTTKFEFNESKNDELGKIILEGYNKELAEDSHFTLNCLLEDSGKCLVTEGFGYKYTINNTLVEGLK